MVVINCYYSNRKNYKISDLGLQKILSPFKSHLSILKSFAVALVHMFLASEGALHLRPGGPGSASEYLVDSGQYLCCFVYHSPKLQTGTGGTASQGVGLWAKIDDSSKLYPWYSFWVQKDFNRCLKIRHSKKRLVSDERQADRQTDRHRGRHKLTQSLVSSSPSHRVPQHLQMWSRSAEAGISPEHNHCVPIKTEGGKVIYA